MLASAACVRRARFPHVFTVKFPKFGPDQRSQATVCIHVQTLETALKLKAFQGLEVPPDPCRGRQRSHLRRLFFCILETRNHLTNYSLVTPTRRPFEGHRNKKKKTKTTKRAPETIIPTIFHNSQHLNRRTGVRKQTPPPPPPGVTHVSGLKTARAAGGERRL